jgi:3-deoxy-7-phosphoheptulonate synthase
LVELIIIALFNNQINFSLIAIMIISPGNKKWQPNSWRNFLIKQQPIYEDLNKLKKVEEQLTVFAPLVAINEIERLKLELAMVAEGKAFLLQGGDCAESFAEFSNQNIKSFVRTFLQMTVALMYGLKKPVVKVGRIAGQYAKPRSDEFETIENIRLPSYRGDIINSIEFSEQSRQADPQRLIQSYFYSAATLNYIRLLTKGGYASLDNVSIWNDEYVLGLNSRKHIEKLVNNINQTLSFVEACGINSKSTLELNSANFYTSHEGLLLNYEEAFVKKDKHNDQFYDLSAHMLWIGDRTRSLDEAHVEFMRGIANPIGFKVGPSITIDNLLKLIELLNPSNEAGKITLISRMGAAKINDHLPQLIEAVKKEGKKVIWSCDPMHGNTIKSANYKTRKFDDILQEIKLFFQIHHECKTYAGGIHFEMTGQDVTECLGGNQEILENDLQNRYHTHCDPRLNSSQSIELAFLIAQELQSTYKK